MKKLIIYNTGVFFCCTLFISCVSLKPLDYKGVENFSIAADISNPQVSFDLRLYNPNNWGVKVKRMKLNVLLNENSIGIISGEKKTHIKARSDFVFPLMVKLSLKDAVQVGFSSLMGRRGVSLSAKGDIVLTKWLLLRKKINVEYSESSLKIR